MFSCLFPTGFSATFSTLAFIFSIPLFLLNVRAILTPIPLLVGLTLFLWLAMSILWSDTEFNAAIKYLSEYRIYFMLPVFLVALLTGPDRSRWLLIAVISGCSVALLASYALASGFIDNPHNKLSLANRIYHGFIMSVFYLIAISLARCCDGVLRIFWFFVALVVAFNVLFIETGRTGYLLISAVTLLFIFLILKRLYLVGSIVCVIGLLVTGYLGIESFQTNVDLTVTNFEQMIRLNNHNSGVGHRVLYYGQAIAIGLENPLTGVGVGDVASELASRYEDGRLLQFTDNVHSEFMNMLIAGGVPALILFSGFLGSLAHYGFQQRVYSRVLGDAILGLSVIICIASLFNSTIKDYGEKHALLILIPLLFSSAIRGHLKREVV